jgi:hypothetical protein
MGNNQDEVCKICKNHYKSEPPYITGIVQGKCIRCIRGFSANPPKDCFKRLPMQYINGRKQYIYPFDAVDFQRVSRLKKMYAMEE